MLQNVPYAVIMLFCISVLALILKRVRCDVFRLQFRGTFTFVVAFALLTAVAEFLSVMVDGQHFALAREINELVNAVYYASLGAMGFCWMRFAGYVMRQRFWNDRNHLMLLGLPMVFSFVESFLSIRTGWVFGVDSSNAVYGGPLCIVIYLCCYFYMAICSVIALRRVMMKRYYADHALYWSIASFGFIPFVSVLLQLFVYQLPTVSPGIAVVLLLVFVTAQSRLISIDPLTRLNNRGHLQRYLSIRVEKSCERRELYLFFLDVEHLKRINESLGLEMGNRALLLVADMLKRVCGPRGHFISRFGGDEFVVVAELNNFMEAEDLYHFIQEAIPGIERNFGRPLALKVGFARYEKTSGKISDFLDRMDAHLYVRPVVPQTE